MSKTYYDTPLWDSSLSIEERLDYLLSEMTLEEEIQSMGTGNPRDRTAVAFRPFK